MYNDRCEFWPETAKSIVKRFIPSGYYSLGNSFEFKYQTKYAFISQKMVISYNLLYKVFVVWNVMNSNFVGDTKTLSLGKKGKSFVKSVSTERLVNTICKFEKKNETVLLVGENKFYEHWSFKKDGASLICRLLFEEATDINFYVGRAINPAHQNPDLPINFNIKMNLVEELSKSLKKMGKRIKVSYF